MSSVVSSTDSAVARRHVLASRNFRLLWLGQAISTFGDKFTEIAIPIFVYNLTGSAWQLGLAFLVQTIAALIFGLIAGVLTDRWDRRRTMIAADVLRAGTLLAILGIPLLRVELNAQLFLLYALSFFAAAVKQFFLPAKVALIPDTVSESQLMSANSLDQSTMTLVSFFGFAAAGAIVGWLGARTAFWIDSSTFLLSAIFIILMQLPHYKAGRQSENQESIFAGIRVGLKHVWSQPILKGTVLLSLFAPLAVGATQALLLVFTRKILQAGDFEFGLLEGTFGIGVAAGAFILSKFATDVPRGRLLAIGVIGMGAGQLLGVAVPLIVDQVMVANTMLLMSVSLPFFFLGAACNAAVFIGIRTIVQENAPREIIGRTFSVIMVVSSGAMALGAGMAGTADLFGVGAMLLIWGGVLVVVGLGAMSWRTFREA